MVVVFVFDRKQINTKTAFKSYIDKIPNSNPLGVWIYSEEFYSLPEYGYKIHVSCDGNNYHSILEICLPYLIENCISFKIISSYSHMVSLNRGEYGYTQIGKVITVYPKDFLAFKKIVFDLYLMTKYIRSVAIPSDFNIFDSEVIYYRFGELNGEEDRTNKEVSDNRIRYIDESCEYLLPWHNIKRYSFIPDFLYPIKNIHSNGKSKLFKAYDSRYKKFCFLKIGIFLGNIEKNNVDSFDRVAWESYVLKNLTNEKFLPDYLDSFIVGNDFFLLEEFIDGKSLGESLIDNSINGREIDISIEIFHIVKKLHSLGYRLIDLSLNNFMFDLEQIYIVDL